MIIIKTEEDIKAIKQACAIYEQLKTYTLNLLKKDSSRTLIQIDKLMDKFIKSKGATSTFYKMYGFPKHICMSVNSTVIHGIPDDYILQPTDKITFDCGVTFNNHVCDSAFIYLGPEVSEEQRKIAKVCEEALEAGIKAVKPDGHIGDISAAVDKVVTENGYFHLEGFTGHGCGNKLHEDPMVPNYGKAGTGAKLKPGMVLCIEPMIMANTKKYSMVDQWDVIAEGNNVTAHCEGMVLVTKDGFERLS